MTEIIFDKQSELVNRAVGIIVESITNLLKTQERVVLAVPGGRSVAMIFDILKEQDIPWDKVHLFMVDERLVSLDSDDSNFKLVKEHLVSDKIPRDNIHPFMVDLGVKNYKNKLKSFGGVFDIVLLSSGEDGHIGALYPNHHSIDSDEDFFIDMHDSPKLPNDRMSASRNLLLKSKTILVLFFGLVKLHAYRDFLDDNLSVSQCPVKLIQNIRDSYILTDIKTDKEVLE